MLLELKKVDSSLADCEKALSEWSYLRLFECYTTSGLEGPFQRDQDSWLLLHQLIRYEPPSKSMTGEYPLKYPELLPASLTEKGRALCSKLFSRVEMSYEDRTAFDDAIRGRVVRVLYRSKGDEKPAQPFVALYKHCKVEGFYETQEEAVGALSKLEKDAGPVSVQKIKPGYIMPPGAGHRVNWYWRKYCAGQVWEEESQS